MQTPSSQTDASDDTHRTRRRRHRRRIVLAMLAIVVAAACVVGVDLWQRGSGSSAKEPDTSSTYPTSLATVTTQATLSSRTQLNGRLGYAGSYSIPAQGSGIVTATAQVGAVVTEGEVLYRTDEQPVVLLYGTTPMYRDLAEGADASDVSGRDVGQLNKALVRLGYAHGLGLDPDSNEFSWATKIAVERLQDHLGVEQTGRLARGQLVFLPTAARITTVSATVGTPAAPGAVIMQATSTGRQVAVALDASQQTQVKAGDKVTITLPDGHTTPGVVSTVGTVATSSSSGSGSSSSGSSSGSSGSSSSPTISVEITPSEPTALGTLDQAPVQVTIIAATVKNALTVPVTALLSQPGGTFAVEVVDGDGPHRLITVRTGLFDDADGLVQVTGSELTAGQRVVVPAS